MLGIEYDRKRLLWRESKSMAGDGGGMVLAYMREINSMYTLRVKQQMRNIISESESDS